jgi:hypothetical protein
MTQQALPGADLDLETGSDLAFHASGFIARGEGTWTNASLARFRHFLRLRRLVPTTEALMRAIEHAQREYLERPRQLTVCDEHPCRDRRDFDLPLDPPVNANGSQTLSVRKTGCQGLCKRAPIASLRVGQCSQVFGEVASARDWTALLSFAEAAARADSLLVPAGEAERLFFDPGHPREVLGAHLRPLNFLLGRFRGEGNHCMSPYTFQKELVGTYEAGGRFVALRMDARYPTAGGGQDVHKALVIVGADPSSGAITGRAFTDGGLVHEYAVEQRERSLSFADARPDHSQTWTRARKVLQPTDAGFEERLEVDDGTGFKTYYAVSMRRLAAS